MSIIRSRDNPRVKRWAKLVQDSSLRRKEGAVVIEGPHVVAEALAARIAPQLLIVSESGLENREIAALAAGLEQCVVADAVFRAIVDSETPSGVAAEIGIPKKAADPKKHAVFLEGVQDPGNVGAILRSAAAFGVGEVVLDRGCADAWSPKVLRAGQGAHFKLALRSVQDLATELRAFEGITVCTVLTEGERLATVSLQGRLGWVFGSEGKGVSESTAKLAARRVTIPMAPGSESINVAAAAAICLYEGFRNAQ